MRHERAGHTLQTMVVNEAYLRLVDVNRVDWQDRARGIGAVRGRGQTSRAVRNCGQVILRPAADSAQRIVQRATERRRPVVDAGRHDVAHAPRRNGASEKESRP
jgi:hypothetical protein